MEQRINWLELKRDYLAWRSELVRLTEELLTSDGFELSHGNEEGYFHQVPDYGHFAQMKNEWSRVGKVPEEWISRGKYPGIWTSMFSPHNTYGFTFERPVTVIRFYFKDGFFIYDRVKPNHRAMLASWSRNRENLWRKLTNESEESLELRMELHGYPSHKGFYEDSRFGAFIGYSDYVCPVIALEDSVEKVEFLEL